jgi:hypothetical protein
VRTLILEIRDAGTFIPVLCVDMNWPANEVQRWYLRSCGYPLDGRPNVAISHLAASGRPFSNDPYAWTGARTMTVAHNWILDNWENLSDGDVVCVETILGERTEPKVSERFNKN